MFPYDFVCLSHCYTPGCFFVTVDAWIINNIFDYNLSITVHVMQVINFRSPIHNTTSQSTRATADHDYDIPLFIFTTIAICQGKGDGICVLKNKTSPVKISPVSMILQNISVRLVLHLFLLSMLLSLWFNMALKNIKTCTKR